ncbi:DEAD/DEAH box helicase [Jiangella alkaliphila]|uniref:DEAD/DEAH box helicase n=2 Tax=Jiangella alkaliphila TaxID=419479 RepID=A0A1H2GEF5_9ACTN|nr:DEAD/DEAH box helicase [Jiangella alkaliphila]
MRHQGVNRRKNRDRLLELLALERLDTATSFGHLAEDQVETIVAIALAEVTDDPQDQVFVLLECLNLLIRDGQFARMKLLAARLRSVERAAAAGRPFLELSISAIASSLAGSATRAANDLARGLGPRTRSDERDHGEHTRRDLAVAAAIKSALVDDDASFARRARDLMTRMGDGLGVSLLDSAIAWQSAREGANPLANLVVADPSFEDEKLADYVRRRGIEVLFPPQISAIRNGLTTDEELTVSLPTSSGKTLLAEFKIAATLHRHPEATVIYVAPYRLLSRQVTREFQRHLPRLGHVVQNLGTGYDLDTPSRFGNVLVSTPERLDALLRKAASDAMTADALERCRLVVFDEMHLIGRAGRGPRFEMLLTRLKLRYADMRFLALSAASQGVDEVADWLTDGRLTKGARRPTGTIEVAWRTNGRLIQRVERRTSTGVGDLDRSGKPLDDAALLISRLSPAYRPVLAVCTQRAYAESLATRLVEDDPLGSNLWISELDADQADRLDGAVKLVASMMGPRHPLTVCLRNGVGFHHAGVPSLVLGIIEELAAHRVLRAVSATTTVAEGADLPFLAVVIPHLNFQGSTGKLERDLYLNIIGRAGRVNVAMEGIVFILDSGAPTLRNHISQSLWTTAAVGRVRGQLTSVTDTPRSPDEIAWYGEYESQVMGWLGDGDSYHKDQSTRLAAGTFTYQAGNTSERRYVEGLTQTVLESLEDRGFAVAASPYRLTDRGERARLTGLNPQSVVRLETTLAAGKSGWLPTLADAVELTGAQREQVARTIYESSETMANTLWLRRARKTETARSSYLAEFARMRADEHLDSDIFWAEVSALVLWIAGETLDAIAETMPTFGHTGLFGSSDRSSRVSDVAEYVSRIGYPGSWTWTAAHTLMRELHGLSSPTWISDAIEYGAPTETAVNLQRSGGLSRPGALHLAAALGPSWDTAAELLRQDDGLDVELTAVDQDRLRNLRASLQQEGTE